MIFFAVLAFLRSFLAAGKVKAKKAMHARHHPRACNRLPILAKYHQQSAMFRRDL
jgi:hypothetical protein